MIDGIVLLLFAISIILSMISIGLSLLIIYDRSIVRNHLKPKHAFEKTDEEEEKTDEP